MKEHSRHGSVVTSTITAITGVAMNRDQNDSPSSSNSASPLAHQAASELPWGHPPGWPLIVDGHEGKLRANAAHSTLDGRQRDVDAVAAWFVSLRGRSPATLEAYRKEVGRFLLWAAEQRRSLSDMVPADYHAYERFLEAPEPAEKWIASGRKHSRRDPRWRPFAGALAPKNRRYAMAVLGNLLTFLVDIGFLRYNAIKRIGHVGSQGVHIGCQTHDHQHFSAKRRSLSQAQWTAIRSGIDQLPAQTTLQWRRRARMRLAFDILHTLGVRLSALQARSGTLSHTACSDGTPRWYWQIITKGQKPLELPFPTHLINQLTELRENLGRPPYPTRNDELPIIPRLSGDLTKPLTRQALTEIINHGVRSGCDVFTERGDHENARLLRQVSAHWLRHTAASETLMHTGDIRLTAELLGHADIRTTQAYTHVTADRLWEALEQRQVNEKTEAVDKSGDK